jgi:NAD(P)H-flavin reductase
METILRDTARDAGRDRACIPSPLVGRIDLGAGVRILEFAWAGPIPRSGQFFMLKTPAFFLSRPFSLLGCYPQEPPSEGHTTLRFLIALRGRGTEELFSLAEGAGVEITGPLGNGWADFVGASGGEKPIALVGGGVGLAPVLALAEELERCGAGEGPGLHLYAGFRSPPGPEWDRILKPPSTFIAAEEGAAVNQGRITDFLEVSRYAAVYACGPEGMLATLAALCRRGGVPCFVSLERRMACGVGACLGCSVETSVDIGAESAEPVFRRCCTDGPIFPAETIFPARGAE